MTIKRYLLSRKRISLGIRWWIVFGLCCISQASLARIAVEPSKQQRSTTQLINYFLEKYHYKSVELDDALSEKILQAYLNDLDSNRSYFTAADIQQFDYYRHRLDDALKTGRINPGFEIFNLYLLRLEDRVAYTKQLLSQPFDFTPLETYEFDRSKAAWAKDKSELNEIWRKRIKNDALNLRLTKKTDADIVKTLTKRYEQLLTRSQQLKSEDVFQLFINAYSVSIEPHTSYFSPRATDNFKINMSLSLEGIGAVLQMKNEYTMIRKTVPGGPAETSQQVFAGDLIVGVGQEQEEIVNVIGWRLDDVVDLIRGPKGTTVTLQILPKTASPDEPGKIIKIVRDKIKLEDQAAQKSIETIPLAKGAVKIGVITIPTFYSDMDARAQGDENYRSTTRDVLQLILELKQEGVKGIVVDLRGNGGGSLTEAIDLTGLFIETGPVVQVKDREEIKINEDTDSLMAYTGPLAILVDSNSASASEIFAGAIQDYQRGIILGEPTFGKGTVQTLIDLDRFSRDPEVRLGQLKVTIAQFFRVNGDSTQHRGVVPDIAFPFAGNADEHGERALPNALSWSQVTPAPHSSYQVSPQLIQQLQAKHQQRIKKEVGFKFLLEEVRLEQQLKAEKLISLNEQQRQQERSSRKQQRLELYNAYRVARGLEPKKELADETDEEELDAVDDKNTDKEKHALDAKLQEAAAILTDAISLFPVSRAPFIAKP